MIFYTSICANYLPKAMALAASVKAHNPGATFVLCLVEREVPLVAREFEHFDDVVLAKDAGWDNFDAFMFRHSIVEASTAVKPRFLQYLLERFVDADKFVYLDPDVLVYSRFIELEEILDHHSIVLAPHLLRPGNIDMEISSLAHGSYNLGFLAVRRSDNCHRFLDWWATRLFLFCYDDKVRGIFTDQKWIDLAPSFFDVHILKHHGYDFATWSLLDSDLRKAGHGYVVNGDPLRFIHFSGLDSGTIDKAIGWWLREDNREDFVALYTQYLALLDAHGQQTLGSIRWSYADYTSGEKIEIGARVAYRDPDMWERYPEPFGEGNAVLCPSAAATGVLEGAAHSGSGKSELTGILQKLRRSRREIGVVGTLKKSVGKVFAGPPRR